MACLKVTVDGVVNEYCTIEGNPDCFTYVDLQTEPCCLKEEECPLPLQDVPSKICIDRSEGTKDGKPVMSRSSAEAIAVKAIFDGQEHASLNYIHRFWGIGNTATFGERDATLFTDTEKQISAHRTASDAKIECSTKNYPVPIGCGFYSVPRLTTTNYRTTCKEQK